MSVSMERCKHCNKSIEFQPGPAGDPGYPYVWVDETGGDVCAWDGANAPHSPDAPVLRFASHGMNSDLVDIVVNGEPIATVVSEFIETAYHDLQEQYSEESAELDRQIS